MNDPLLIEKLLADGLTDEETALLEAAVGSDPAAAGRLVAAARMDQHLAARLGPSRSELACLAGLKRGHTAAHSIDRWRRPLALAAALVFMLGVAAAVGAWIRSIGSAHPDSMAIDPPRETRPFVPARVLVMPDRVIDPPRVETETPAMASLRRFLSSYYLTDLKLGTARPLDEALEKFLQRARELNHLKNPVIERLSAELAPSEESDGRPERVVAFPLKDVSLMDGLKWVAASNRSEVFLKEPGVITFRPWEPDENETLVTEVVRVRPDLLTRPVATFEQSRAGDDKAPSEAGADPFVGSADAQALPRLTPIELFQSWGIAFGDQASASYDAATATMTIRQTASTLRMIRELVGLETSRLSVMAFISTKILELPVSLPVKDELLTDEQFQLWLREINQTKGVKLLVAPKIVVRSGQRGMIDSTGEIGIEGAWRGLRIPVAPVFEGEVVKVVGAVEIRLPEARQPGQSLVQIDVKADDLVTTATDFETIIPPGQTAVFSVNESPDGPYFAMAVTVATIDPSGQRVAPEDEPVEAALPGQDGEGGDDRQ